MDNKQAVWSHRKTLNNGVEVYTSEGGAIKFVDPSSRNPRPLASFPITQLALIQECFSQLQDTEVEQYRKERDLSKERAKVAKEMAKTVDNAAKHIQAIKEQAQRAGLNPEEVLAAFLKG